MTKLNSLLPLGALAVLACGTAAAQPAPVSVEKTQTISATVASIDAAKRLVELRKDGESKTIEVPPEVRNFERIKVGDEVVVTYYQGLAAEFKKKGESKTIGVIDATTGTARMPRGGESSGRGRRQQGHDDRRHRVSRSRNALGDLCRTCRA